MSQDAEPDGDARRDRRGVLLALAGVAVLLGALYVAGYFLVGNRIPTGVEVVDVDIGGMSPAEAEATLRRELAPRADDPLHLSHDEQVYRVDPRQAGLSFDVAETVAQVGAQRTWDPRQMVQVLVGSNDVDPVVDVDAAALTAAVDSLRREVEVDPTEAAVSFTASGSPRVTRPQAGLAIDGEELEDALVAAYLRDPAPVEIPTKNVKPQVGEDDVRRALREVARPAMSAPVTLAVPGPDVPLPVSAYAPALTLRVSGGELTPTLDEDRLEDRLDPVMAQLGSEPRDASVVLRGGGPVVLPDQPGVRLDAADVTDALLSVLTETGRDRRIKVGTAIAQADFTTADARALKIREPVSSFVTYYEPATYRNINQSRAAELISGTVLKPGDTFSFNGTVGKRTRASGFVTWFVINEGVLAAGVGGGVAQVAATTFNAASTAGMEAAERTPHSYYSSPSPTGRASPPTWTTINMQ